MFLGWLESPFRDVNQPPRANIFVKYHFHRKHACEYFWSFDKFKYCRALNASTWEECDDAFIVDTLVRVFANTEADESPELGQL